MAETASCKEKSLGHSLFFVFKLPTSSFFMRQLPNHRLAFRLYRSIENMLSMSELGTSR